MTNPYPKNPLAVPIDFEDTPKDELQAYFQRFVSLIPERLTILGAAVKRADATWRSTLMPDSLVTLESWLLEMTGTRAKTPTEIAMERSGSRFDFDYPSTTITEETLAYAMDTGMYFSQTLLRRHTQLRWELPLSDRRFIDYGQPVLSGFTKNLSMNPTRIATNISYSVCQGRHTPGRLLQVFDFWSQPAR